MMPNLKSFEIECATLDEGFTRFILRHLPSLDKVHMGRCVNDDWVSLFKEIVAAKPRQLTDFTVQHFPTLHRALHQTEAQWRAAEKELRKQLEPDRLME